MSERLRHQRAPKGPASTPAARLIELQLALQHTERLLDEANARISVIEDEKLFERARFYAAGIVDGEGSVIKTYRHKDVSGSPTVRISISSIDWELIQAMHSCYTLLGIESSIHEHDRSHPAGRKLCWTIVVRKGTSIVRASEILPLKHHKKMQKLLAGAQELKLKSRFGVLMGHGTNACYARGCRCDECRYAHSDRNRRYKKRKIEESHG